MPTSTIGSRVARRRKELHLTQEELAKKLGISRGQLSLWECGKQQIRLIVVPMLAQVLGVREEWLKEEVGLKEQVIGEYDETIKEALKGDPRDIALATSNRPARRDMFLRRLLCYLVAIGIQDANVDFLLAVLYRSKGHIQKAIDDGADVNVVDLAVVQNHIQHFRSPPMCGVLAEFLVTVYGRSDDQR